MTEGVEYLYLETHNWGKTVKFWQELGFRLDLDLGHSGRLVHPKGGPALFVEEVPEDRGLALQIYLRASDPESRPAGVAAEWTASHWGTQLLEFCDPDGRSVVMQHGLADD